MKEYKKFEDLPATLNAEQVAQYLGLSRGGAYNLLNGKEFPSIRIGKRLVVTKECFLNWIKENTRNNKK